MTARAKRGSVPDYPLGSTICMDIVFFGLGEPAGESPALLSREASVGYLMLSRLASKGHDDLMRAVREHVGSLLAHRLYVHKAATDSEACFQLLMGPLQQVGIELVLIPPSIHNSPVERPVRDLRADVRALLVQLDYLFPVAWKWYLIFHCVRIRNQLPNRFSNGLPPRSQIIGEVRPDRTRDELLRFGETCVAHAGNETNNEAATGFYCVFLGFASQDGHRGAIVCNVQTGRICIVNKLEKTDCSTAIARLIAAVARGRTIDPRNPDVSFHCAEETGTLAPP
jgi:hypothetical protein